MRRVGAGSAHPMQAGTSTAAYAAQPSIHSIILSFFLPFCTLYPSPSPDMESMFELMDRAPDVDDAPGAGQLAAPRGGLAFENVSFRRAGGGSAAGGLLAATMAAWTCCQVPRLLALLTPLYSAPPP